MKEPYEEYNFGYNTGWNDFVDGVTILDKRLLEGYEDGWKGAEHYRVIYRKVPNYIQGERVK
jgi:hypothetical protein